MAEPGLGELEEVPPLLTGSSGEGSGAEDFDDASSEYSGGPPHLFSESSGGESDSPLRHLVASGLRSNLALGTARAAASPQQPPGAHEAQRRFYGRLDEIDQSDYGQTDEEEEDGAGWGPPYDARAGMGGHAFIGDPAGLGTALGQAQLEPGLNEGLLQQFSVQELLEAVLLGAGGGGGRGRSWGPGSHLFGSPALAVDASQIPAGLEGSAWQHALSLAEQGFVTAIDPARHAACAAEGIPGGRQQAGLMHRIPAAAASAAASGPAPVAASRAGLQRADSAAGGGGGLQRGDSAASHGLNRLARQPPAAGSRQPGAALSRLASASHGVPGSSSSSGPGALGDFGLAAPAAAGDDADPPGLAASESSSDDETGLFPRMNAVAASPRSSTSGSSSGAGVSGNSRRHSSASATGGQQPGHAPTSRGRRRRNAIFGQLPGLAVGPSLAGISMPVLLGSSDGEGAAGSLEAAAADAAARGRRQRPVASSPDWVGPLPLPLAASSDGSSGRGSSRGVGRRRSAAAASARRRRLSSSLPDLEAGSDDGVAGSRAAGAVGDVAHQPARSDNAGSSRDGSGGSRAPQPRRGSDNSAGDSDVDFGGMRLGLVAGDAGGGAPILASQGECSDSNSASERRSASVDQLPGLLSAGDSSSSSSADEPGLRRMPSGRQPAGRFLLQSAHAQEQAQRPGRFTADQRDVMLALTELLPQQRDGVGWAELAAYVRSHRGSAQRGGSGGGVQLLSRLVAAAASRFPGEAEAAGLTERPLAPPPTVATATPAGASAGASSAASPVASDGAGEDSTEAEAELAVQGLASPQHVQQAQQAQQALELLGPRVTLVVGSEAAAVELQQQLGSAVRVLAQTQLDIEVAQHAQHVQPALDVQQQQHAAAHEGGPSEWAAAESAAPVEAASGQPVAPAGPGSQSAAAAASAGTAALAALAASIRGAGSANGSAASSVASAEAALRLLTLPDGPAAQHPLPPLVAAALAAARTPPPDQAEE